MSAPIQGIVDTRTPVKSSMGFVSPDAIVNPSPSIRNLVHDPAPNNVAPAPATVPTPAETPTPATMPTPVETEPAQSEPPTAEPVAETVQTEPAVAEPAAAAETHNDASQQAPTVTEPTQNDTPPQNTEPPQQPSSSPVDNPEKYFEKFKEQWDAMVDSVFSKVPTLLTPLKNYPLEVKNNVVYLKLRNSMQVDDFSIKKVSVLQYLRNHFDPNINDMEVSIDDKTELKKYILDEKDKIQELQHQNPDFAEFMQTLHLQSCN